MSAVLDDITEGKPRVAVDPPLDRAALDADLDALHRAARDGPDSPRNAIVDRFKRALDDGRAAITARFESDNRGLACARRLAGLQDDIVRALHAYVLRHVRPLDHAPSASERLGIVAVGGYGRGTLAPGSDVDLLFLLPYKQTPWGESVVEAMLYILWDLRLKVGHATRSVDECLRQARADMTIRTTLIEARPLCGDAKLFEELRIRFDREVVQKTAPEFVAAKLAERESRLKRGGMSRYVVEPNVKEGKGGLRDLNTLFWIAHYVYRVKASEDLVEAGLFTRAEFRMFRRCEEFLWRVRCHLHLVAGRAEERLSFDHQRVIAARLGYASRRGLSAVERFMKHYFLTAKDVGDLTAIVCAALEEKEAKPPAVFDRLGVWFRRARALPGTGDFAVEVDRITVARPDAFERDPVNLIRLFWLSDQHALPLHPDATRLVTLSLRRIDAALRRNAEANRLFLEILTSRNAPEVVLRRMNEAGVLGRFIPEFGTIVAMMQFNMYHHYTVDEHLLRAVGNLSEIDAGRLREEHPLANELMPALAAGRRALYLAVFLHDVAKGREADHSIAGARLVRTLGARFGLAPVEIDLAAWLVHNHLVMSNTAQSRDLADRRTIETFADVVQTPERLRCLLLLTICDIKAVGPAVWNGWKGQLLRTLYHETGRLIGGQAQPVAWAERLHVAHGELRAALPDWSDAELDAYVGRHYPTYWLRVDLATKLRHAAVLRAIDRQSLPLVTETRTDAFRAVTELLLVTPDHPRLLSVMAGACAVAGADIVDAQVFTTVDGLALDTFSVSRAFEQDEDEQRRAQRIVKTIERALRGEIRLDNVVAAKGGVPKGRDTTFPIGSDVVVDNEASNRHTLLEVSGMDRPGLLYDLTRAIAQLNLNIASAQVATFGEKAVDSFYVTDLTGAKVWDDNRQAGIRRAILATLAG